jgi:hypothetical protein
MQSRLSAWRSNGDRYRAGRHSMMAAAIATGIWPQSLLAPDRSGARVKGPDLLVSTQRPRRRMRQPGRRDI